MSDDQRRGPKLQVGKRMKEMHARRRLLESTVRDMLEHVDNRPEDVPSGLQRYFIRLKTLVKRSDEET